METTISYQPFIRTMHIMMLLLGFTVLLVSLKLDRYLNVYLAMFFMLSSIVAVEAILGYVIYYSLISKATRLRQWTRKTKFIAFVFCLIALIWSVMLLVIGHNIINILLHN